MWTHTMRLRHPRCRTRATLTATGLSAVAAVATSILVAGLGAPAGAAAQPSPISRITTSSSPSDSGSRERAFDEAAREFGVPQPILEAVSFAQTRWDFHAGHSTSGGYGPMHLVDAGLGDPQAFKGLGVGPSSSTDSRSASSATDPLGRADRLARADTLARAAALTGLTEDALRTDELANIRGGAALLAEGQRALGLPVGVDTDPGSWYAAVAAASGSVQEEAAASFADDTFRVLTQGAQRHTVDGKDIQLASVAATPRRDQLARLGLVKQGPGPVDCPESLACEWIPAPYEQYGPGAGDYGNHDVATRPAAPTIRNIVIHNTEGSYASTLQAVANPTYVSWQYTLRSSDGHIAQHVAPKDIAWHANNWYVNMHSIGLEHEGFAAAGADWFSEPMYRTSASLVAYLAKKYRIPLDRQHIFGHDQVPGVTPAYVRDMHWDPGPYWDWEHYFELLRAPLHKKTNPSAKDLVRILPGFEDNEQVVTGCTAGGVPCRPQGTNFVYLHQAPDASAPLIRDIGLHPDGTASTTHVSDIGARASAGLEFAVAERQGDWVAIWFNGEKGWFHNPKSAPVAVPVKGTYVVPRAGLAQVPIYGRAYPEPSAYPQTVPVQALAPLQYTFAAGQRYAVGDLAVPTDYYPAVTFSAEPPDGHLNIVGQDRYYQVSFGNRLAYVRAADVDVVKSK